MTMFVLFGKKNYFYNKLLTEIIINVKDKLYANSLLKPLLI